MSGPTRKHSQQGTPGRIVGPGAPATPAPKGACTCRGGRHWDNTHFPYCPAGAAPTKPAEPVCTCDGTQSVKTCLKCSQEHPSKKYVLAQPEPARGKPEYEYIKSDGTTDWGDSNPPGPKTGNVRSKEQGDIERAEPAKWVPGDKAEWVVGTSHVVAGEIKAVWDEGAVFQAPGAAAAAVSFVSGRLRRPLPARKVRKQVTVREWKGPGVPGAWLSDDLGGTRFGWTPTGRTHEYEVDE